MTAPREVPSNGPQGALAPGIVFAGRYRIVRCLAAGGMGSVYEAVHLETDRRRALKVMHPHLFQSDDMRDRFKREARIAAQVESEHIVDVSDAGVDEATRTPFLVMELLQGEELGDRLKRVGPLPPTEVVTYLQQAALALDKTHSRMIVHRDLKPENLFLTQREDGSLRVKILDFGVAKLVAEGATGDGATRSLGTPLYMAPEQFRAGSKLLPAADIHALGMMAFTLLAGEPYWAPEARTAGDVIAFAMTVVQGPKESAVRRAAARGVVLPPAFDGWFARVTAMNPADRYPRASEAVLALAEALGIGGSGAAVSAPSRASVPEPSTSPLGLGGASQASPLGVSGSVAGTSAPFGASQSGVGQGASGALRVPTVSMGGMDPWRPSSGAPPGMLDRAVTSTGAAVAPVPAVARRSLVPMLAGGALLGAGILAVVLWMLLGRGGAGSGESAGSAATAGVTAALSATEARPAVTEAPAAPGTKDVPVPLASATGRPEPTGPLPAVKSTARPAGGPGAKPTTAPSAKPGGVPTSLIGRD